MFLKVTSVLYESLCEVGLIIYIEIPKKAFEIGTDWEGDVIREIDGEME